MTDAQFTQLAFTMHATKGVYAVLLGAGASMGANMPTAWEIVLDIIRKDAGMALTGKTDREVEAWYTETYGKAADYSDVIASRASTPAQQQALLKDAFEPTETERANGQKVPSAAHHALAQLARAGHVRLFITTNFDPLIEQALDAAAVPYSVVTEAADLASTPSLMHGGVQVLKLHGDYRKANVRNGTADLASYPPALAQHLQEMVRHFGLIMCGWSADYDVALREAIVTHGTLRFPGAFVNPRPPSPAAQDVIRQTRALIFEETADDFFPKLQRRVQALDEHTYVPPLTLAAIGGEVRQALRRPEEARQRLKDLLDGLADQLHDTLTGPALPWINVDASHLEAARQSAAPLLYALGTLTKYDAEGRYTQEVQEALERIDFDPEEDSFGGYQPRGQGLHALPAALLAYGAAATAIANQNVHYLKAVLQTQKYERGRVHDDLVPLISRLPAVNAVINWGDFKQPSKFLRAATADLVRPFLNPRTLELDLDLAELVLLYALAAMRFQPGSMLVLDDRVVVGDYLYRIRGEMVRRRFAAVFPQGKRRLADLLSVEGITVLDDPVRQWLGTLKSLPDLPEDGLAGRLAQPQMLGGNS